MSENLRIGMIGCGEISNKATALGIAAATNARLEMAKGARGIMVLTGEPGTGKTVSLRRFVDRLNTEHYRAIYLPLSTVTVLDEDPLPGLALSGLPCTVAEDAGTVWVSVVLSGLSDKNITVEFATADGTAVAGEDYAQTNGILRWREGKGTNLAFAIPILDDQLIEGNEALQVAILNPVNAVISGPPSGSITILENDLVAPFAILQLREGPSREYIVLEWESVGGANYAIESADSLYEEFITVKKAIVGTPPVNVYTDTRPRADRRFYRIRAW